MTFNKDVIEAIGHTPLIKLKRASEMTGCTILGKAEVLNPGGSVKDRAALFIVRDAEERGQLRPGGVIVEGTAGTRRRSAPQSRNMSCFSWLCVSGMTMTVR